ncbi:WD40-repeat-containing domain protein [Umbelopsis sp. AD052]|nr:WD40-repeat-containing domain protein [Umbelopsis sp. AD052]
MNLGDKSSNELLFINFNQDFSCISVGIKNGYKIYNCDPFGKCYSKSDGGIGIVEMLFCTSLVALVGAGEQPAFSPRHLQIINTKRQSTICELTFPTSILSVKMNRRRLIVVLEEQIFVYDISNMKLLHTIDTSPNPSAICALSPSSENCYIAYPSPSSSTSSPLAGNHLGPSQSSYASGDVLIFDALSLQVVNIVQAHKSPVSCIAMNSDGTLLATASDKGTVIRVFTIPDSRKVFQFRRGSYPTKIYSISFNLVSSLLCVSSATETVHIFKLSNEGPQGGNNRWGGKGASREEDNRSRSSSVGQMLRRSSMHLGRNIAGSVGSYLPEALTEIWEPARDFASLKLPSAGVQSIVALSNTTPQVMVVTSEGSFYQYNIDLENGGECVLLKQYSLLEEPSDDMNTGILD